VRLAFGLRLTIFPLFGVAKLRHISAFSKKQIGFEKRFYFADF